MPKTPPQQPDSHPAGRALNTARRDDAGASSLEYIGVIMLCALVVALIIAAISPAQLTEATRNALCRILTAGGGECESAPTVQPPDCLLAQQDKNEKFELSATMFTFFNADLSAPIGLTKKVMSDGTVKIYETIGAGVGVSAGKDFSSKGPSTTDAGVSTEAGAEVRLGTEVLLEGGSELTFPSDEAANLWLQKKRNIVAQEYWDTQAPASTGSSDIPEHEYQPTSNERIIRASMKIEATASANLDVSATINKISSFMKQNGDSAGMADGAQATLKVALEASTDRQITVQVTGKGDETKYLVKIDGDTTAGASAEVGVTTGDPAALGLSAQGGAMASDDSSMLLSFNAEGKPLSYTQKWSTTTGLNGHIDLAGKVATAQEKNDSIWKNGERKNGFNGALGAATKQQVVETRTITFDTPEQQHAALSAILTPTAGATFAESGVKAGTQRLGTAKDPSGRDVKSSPFYEYLVNHPELQDLDHSNFSDSREYYDLWETTQESGIDVGLASAGVEKSFSASQLVDAEYLAAPDSQNRRVWVPNLDCMATGP